MYYAGPEDCGPVFSECRGGVRKGRPDLLRQAPGVPRVEDVEEREVLRAPHGPGSCTKILCSSNAIVPV